MNLKDKELGTIINEHEMIDLALKIKHIKINCIGVNPH